MTRKQQRIYSIILIVFGIGIATTLSLMAMEENITYFYTPSDIFEDENLPPQDKAFRLGGLVAEGSLSRNGAIITFIVTDNAHQLSVAYEGITPDLFREGQGIIATGNLNPEGVFVADSLLAKHDENYMPPEVAKALEEVHGSDKTAP